MPIIDDANDMRVEYKIPEEIKSRIPAYFPRAFAGELCSVFGPSIFEKDDETDTYGLAFICCTAGWFAGFKMTCEKLNMEWLVEYHDSLEWYDSDLFDGEMEDMIIEQFIEAESAGTNVYLRHRKTPGFSHGDIRWHHKSHQATGMYHYISFP